MNCIIMINMTVKDRAIRKMKFFNIMKAIFVSGQLKVMINKVSLRLFDKKSNLSSGENLLWLSSNATNISQFCSRFNKELWDEIQNDIDKISYQVKERLKSIPFDLGGGGAFPLLYFVVRLCKPQVVVETGVASGISSFTILDALAKNNSGHLYSSDFPYFRLQNPTQYIGIVIPDSLKSRWSLFIRGDSVNLREICKKISTIDVFHYDSDKSYRGRMAVMEILKEKITDKSWVIFDDIQDNSFFHDLVSRNKYSNWNVLEFEGKWVGVIHPDN